MKKTAGKIGITILLKQLQKKVNRTVDEMLKTKK